MVQILKLGGKFYSNGFPYLEIISIVINTVSLFSDSYYTQEERAGHEVYASLVCLLEHFLDQLLDSLESGSASSGALRSRGTNKNGQMGRLRFWNWIGYSIRMKCIAGTFMLFTVPQNCFNNFWVHFRILKSSSMLFKQTRCLVLAFKVMVSVEDSGYLCIESPGCFDSSGGKY